jgi:hypothetical protein
MAAGRLINEMQEERLLSDYAAVRDARSFIEACGRHYDLSAATAP